MILSDNEAGLAQTKQVCTAVGIKPLICILLRDQLVL
jgi:hypothetical protein